MGLAENIQMHALWSHISRPSAGISLGATLVILAIQLPDGVAQAVVLGDALPAALSVSMAGVATWIVSQHFAHEDNLRPMGLDAGSAAAIAMTMASAAVVAVRRSITGYRLWHLA